MVRLDPDLVEGKMKIVYGTDRLGHDYRYAIDPSKIETQLRWAPRYKFDEALEATVRWYMELYKAL
jgi:dTDP-glucose 4,6-dehydratase